MHYKMEDMIAIVARLTEKYTGHENSSITYEKAEQLMGAVIYCIREATKPEPDLYNPGTDGKPTKDHAILMQTEKLSAQKAYEIGVEKVNRKVKASLELYHRILLSFDDYGNRCLSDTIHKGMPEFFKWYDVKFNPQDTILTLDYPVRKDLSQYQGVDAIYLYLKCIETEQQYLKQFVRAEIIEKLSAYDPEYEDMIDNLYEVISDRTKSSFILN